MNPTVNAEASENGGVFCNGTVVGITANGAGQVRIITRQQMLLIVFLMLLLLIKVTIMLPEQTLRVVRI